MKIAVASEGTEVSQHFGHCANYNLYTIENGQVVDHVDAPSPGHLCGSMAPLLKEQGVDALITGGIGAGAMNAFDQFGITVINGASGDAQKMALALASGNLASRGSLCEGHEGGCDHHHDN